MNKINNLFSETDDSISDLSDKTTNSISGLSDKIDGEISSLSDSLSSKLKTKPTIVYGSYQGAGTSGQSNPTKLTFSGTPLFVAIFYENLSNEYQYMIAVNGVTEAHTLRTSTNNYSAIVSWPKNGISFYAGSDNRQLNTSTYKYYYIALLSG